RRRAERRACALHRRSRLRARPRPPRACGPGGGAPRRRSAAQATARSLSVLMMMPNAAPLLVLDKLNKRYRHGLIRRRTTFSLAADMSFDKPEIIGMLGPNGAGKTTLFEMMTGSNVPTSGRVICLGQDIHHVKYRQRDRLVIHYHQSYQVRKMRRRAPAFLLDAAG